MLKFLLPLIAALRVPLSPQYPDWTAGQNVARAYLACKQELEDHAKLERATAAQGSDDDPNQKEQASIQMAARILKQATSTVANRCHAISLRHKFATKVCCILVLLPCLFIGPALAAGDERAKDLDSHCNSVQRFGESRIEFDRWRIACLTQLYTDGSQSSAESRTSLCSGVEAADIACGNKSDKSANQQRDDLVDSKINDRIKNWETYSQIGLLLGWLLGLFLGDQIMDMIDRVRYRWRLWKEVANKNPWN